jgi:hypothetical protein
MIEMKPVMPKEHGMWAWVLVPLIAGAGSASGALSPFANGLPFILGILFWFLALTPARVIYKNVKRKIPIPQNIARWGMIYGAAGSIFFLMAVVHDFSMIYLLTGLAPLFYLGVRASYKGYQRSFAFEITGVLFLSLLSLAGAYAVTGSVGNTAYGVWALTAVFLLDRNLQSRNIVRSSPRDAKGNLRSKGEPNIVFRINIFIALVALALVSGLLDLFSMKRIFFTPFLPGFLVTGFFFIKPPSTLRQVGWTELFLAIAYVIILLSLKGRLPMAYI